MKKLLIVGAGDGGIILSHSVSASDFDITFIDRSDMHYFQPSLLHAALLGTAEKRISKRRLMPRRSKLVMGTVTSVDLANRSVTADGKSYDYDYVVVDTGSRPDYTSIPGHAGLYREFGDFHSDADAASRMYGKVRGFKGGKVVIGPTYPVFKCPPSPVEAAFLFEQQARRAGVTGNTEITYITPLPRAYPAESINEVVEPILKERGIRVLPFFDVDSVDAGARKIVSIEGDELSYDFAALVPPHKGAGVVKDNCDSDGFVNTDKYTLKIGKYYDAFCIGDATNIQTAKSGVTAHLEAKVVAKRLKGIDARFNGRTNCPFETGYGRALFVISSFESPAVKMRPSRMNYAMKKAMAAMAWPALKGYADPIFDAYFAMTNPEKRMAKSAPGA